MPGFIATGVLFSGIGAAVATAEDLEHGFVDRLRSLPIPRSSVLAARAIADTAILTLASAVTVAIAFAVGFRLHGSAPDGLAAFALVIVFGFAFEWLFIAMGLFAGTSQAAQGMGMIVFPLAFVSSAYVTVASMPGWLQVFAKHQPLTDDGRRRPRAHARIARRGRARPSGLLLRRAFAHLGGRDPRCCRPARGCEVPAQLTPSTRHLKGAAP